MTIYQKELMRKFCLFGCTGRYSENEETLSLIYNGTKIGWMEREGSVYAMVDDNMSEDADEVFSADRNQAKEICEYARLYEASSEGRLPAI